MPSILKFLKKQLIIFASQTNKILEIFDNQCNFNLQSISQIKSFSAKMVNYGIKTKFFVN